jgi:hypothetical protein
MLQYELSACILRGGKWTNHPALSVYVGKGRSSAPDSWVMRIKKASHEKILGNRLLYFWGGDPFLAPDHELGVLFADLLREHYIIIAETPGIVKSGVYGVPSYVVQIGDVDTVRSNWMRFRKEIVVEVTKSSKPDFNLLNRLRASLPVTYLRPRAPDDLQPVVSMLCKSTHTMLSLPPLLEKKQEEKKDVKDTK